MALDKFEHGKPVSKQSPIVLLHAEYSSEGGLTLREVQPPPSEGMWRQ